MKYIGEIYDGRWKVIQKVKPSKNNHQAKYILENIYNGKLITLDARTVKRIADGATTVSKVMAHNLFHQDLKRLRSSSD